MRSDLTAADALPWDARPGLASKARLRMDRMTGRPLLLYPERGLLLNASAAEILALCDGSRSLASIVDCLSTRHAASPRQVRRDVVAFLSALTERKLLIWHRT